jgi:signal transduction histidine kinase
MHDHNHYTILYVDDEPYNLKAFYHAFKPLYPIVTAESGEEALQVLSTQPVAVLITDRRMPDMDGIELLKRVAENHPHIVTMMLTAYGDKESLMRAINEGHVYAFVSKPWNEVDLRLKIDKAIEHYRLLRKNEQLLQELQDANAKLEERIEARTRELAERNRQLEQLTALQNRLFSIISHDLRSPLNTLSNFLQIFINYAERGFTVEELVHIAQDIHAHLQNIQQLLDNLIQWAKLQLQEVDYSLTVVPLKTLFDENTALVRQTAIEKQISLHVAPPNELKVLANREMLSFVLRNLLYNALKFTPEGGTVSMSAVYKGNGHCYIMVEDSGVGMSPYMIDQILQGKGVSRPGTRGERGTGLGLALCHEFVKRMNGSMQIESEEGEGTRVLIRLPLHVESEVES